MKINKLIAITTAVTMLFSIGGGGYNLNEVYASENTSTISIEDPGELLRQHSGTGTYKNGKRYNIKAKFVDSNNFTGWLLKNGASYTDATGISDKTDFSFVADSNKTYVPNRNYSITYNLNGGSATNPTTYSLKDTFTLNNPTKRYYSFTGWTGTGLSSANTTVSIPQGSFGNRTYTANWTEDPIKAKVALTDNYYRYRDSFGNYEPLVFASSIKPDGTLRDNYTISDWYQTSYQGTINVMPGDRVFVNTPVYSQTTVVYNGETVAYSSSYVVPSDVSSISISAYSTYNGGDSAYVYATINMRN